MRIQSRGVDPAYKPYPPVQFAAAPQRQRAEGQYQLRFAGADEDAKRAARRAQKQEMEAMLGGNLKEGIMQRIFRGFVPLDFMAGIDVGLSGDRKKKYEAYGQLIELALRDTRTATPESEAKVRETLANPTPELKAWLDKYNLTADDLAEPVADYVKMDADAYIPPEVWGRMAKIGAFGLKVPTEYGGHGLTQKEYDLVDRALARTTGAIAGAISAHSTIGGALKLGTDEQKAKYYPQLAAGEYMAAFGLTEPGAGTDVGRMKTTARLDDDGKNWVLNGEKIFITNTHRSGVMYVFARTDMGIHSNDPKKHTAFIVELPFRTSDTKEELDRKRAALAAKGMIISDPLNLMMIRGTNQAHIQFKDFKVPYESVLGGVEKIGAGLSEPFNALNAGRAGFGPAYSESANLLTQRSVEHARKREMFKQYGGKEKDMPAIRDKIADMAMKRAALDALSDMVSAYIEQYEDEGYNIIAEAAAIKVKSTEDNWDVAQAAMHVFGGAGTMKEHPSGVERAFRDAWIGIIVEGVNDAMKQLAVGTSLNRMAQEELMKGRLDKWLKNRIMGRFQKGGLAGSDARWLHSRARALNTKVMTVGAGKAFDSVQDALGAHEYSVKGVFKRLNHKMETNQRDLLRMFDVSIDIFTMAAVMLKLKNNPDLPAEEKAALEGYIARTKKEVDRNLSEIQPWNSTDKLNEKVATAWLEGGSGK